jgi:hypothetical protein
MKITKKQIIALDNGETTIRELFPQVFQVELEVGKWYKDTRFDLLFCFQGKYSRKKDSGTYGFSRSKAWVENIGVALDGLSKYTPATKEEVKTALITEAKRRYKTGQKVISLTERIDYLSLEKAVFDYYHDCNELLFNGLLMFHNGKWAGILKTKQMTKEEIEKELGYNIEII